MPTDIELERGVEHIVHDYSVLVLTGEAIPTGTIPLPWNGPAEQSFIVSVRKFADFFNNKRKHSKDMIAEDYIGASHNFFFPTWQDEEGNRHHNAHLFHLSYIRCDPTQRPWDGYRENRLFFEEIKAAWRKFLTVPPRFKDEFDRRIDLKEKELARYNTKLR